jgi:DNA-binding response OmpR family regulator
MSDDQRLLVVDDEEAICEGCRRIFTRLGFEVENTSDAQVGLHLAEKNEYAAILLDIKMPNMTGIEFLEQLRTKRPRVPVILMTGYPSVPNTIAAIRLGVAGYVTKPFTPEEVAAAVQKHVRGAAEPNDETSLPDDPWTPGAEGYLFLRDSWVQYGQDGTARTGALTPRTQAASIQGVRLPKVGETVYQGLPLAAIVRDGAPPQVVVSPLSGVVDAVNQRLLKEPSALWEDPTVSGWIAAIRPTRYDVETEQCRRRRVILVNADANTAAVQQAKLTALGHHVRVAANWDELGPPLQDDGCGAVLVDAASFGQEGPALIERLNAVAPEKKIVLLGTGDASLEAAYRSHRIFYYAVEPFADKEIIEILQAAFRSSAPPAKHTDARKTSDDHIATLKIVNRNGSKVRLAAETGLLPGHEGLGMLIRRRLLDRQLPVETTFGERVVTPNSIAGDAAACDRVVVLMARDIDRLPGSLLRDVCAAYVSAGGMDLGNVTTLVIQPTRQEAGLTGLDEETLAALADHIVHELTSYQPLRTGRNHNGNGK